MSMERISNPQVPIEATFKWLVRQNNEYRRKLDMIVPYTKALEQEVARLGDALSKKDRRIAVLQSQLERASATLPVKAKTFKKALGHIKQGINMLEAGKYADLLETMQDEDEQQQ